MKSTRLCTALFFSSIVLASGPSVAEEPSNKQSFTIDLNRLESSQKGCLLTFVLKNSFDGKVEKSAFEVVLFDQKGLVNLMKVFDFGAFPPQKTKVRQFDLPELDCSLVGRVLINGSTECVVADQQPDACMDGLATQSRSGIEFGS